MNTPNRAAAPHRAALLLVAGLLALAGCGGGEAPPDVATDTQTLVLSESDVITVERGGISQGIALTGTLDPYRVVEVKAQVSGTLGSVRVEEGDRVGRGAVLATITAEGIRSQAASSRAGVSGAQANVAAAEAQLALARERASSAQMLYDEGAMSRLDYQAAQAQAEAAEAGLAAARSQLAAAQSQATGAGEQAARTIVRAPVSGAVSEKLAELGEAVNPGQTLFTVVNTSTLELNGQVGVDQAAQIAVGDPVEFHLDAYPGETFHGAVSRIDPTADPDTRQVGVYLRLDNPGHLVGGLFATGTVVSETLAEELLVPATAVREGDGVAYLLVVENGVITRRDVTVVARDLGRGLVAVSGGLTGGETVIVAPTTDTVAGARVRLAGAPPPADREAASTTPDAE